MHSEFRAFKVFRRTQPVSTDKNSKIAFIIYTTVNKLQIMKNDSKIPQ